MVLQNIYPEAVSEDRHETWNLSLSKSELKNLGHQAAALPRQLPLRADLPSCTGMR